MTRPCQSATATIGAAVMPKRASAGPGVNRSKVKPFAALRNSSELKRPSLSTSQGLHPWSMATARIGVLDFVAAARASSASVNHSPLTAKAGAAAMQSNRAVHTTIDADFMPTSRGIGSTDMIRSAMRNDTIDRSPGFTHSGRQGRLPGLPIEVKA